jgi:prepilin-type processing-associated H-X9-DG protein
LREGSADPSLFSIAASPHLGIAGYLGEDGTVNAVAGRHEMKPKKTVGSTYSQGVNEDSRGNVVFCDGHTEFFSRKDAIRQKYTGSNVVDDPNFH